MINYKNDHSLNGYQRKKMVNKYIKKKNRILNTDLDKLHIQDTIN